jgi:hypothetical protein
MPKPTTFARTSVQTIPSTTLQLGPFGPVTSGFLPTDATNAQLILDQGADWVHDGTLVFTIHVECSYTDAQGSHTDVFDDQAFDLAIPAKFGNPANRMSFGMSLPAVGNATRKLSFSMNVFARRTVSGTYDVI